VLKRYPPSVRQFVEFGKLSCMLMWRVTLGALLFQLTSPVVFIVLPMIISVIMVYVFKSSVKPFPIILLLSKKTAFYRIDISPAPPNRQQQLTPLAQELERVAHELERIEQDRTDSMVWNESWGDHTHRIERTTSEHDDLDVVDPYALSTLQSIIPQFPTQWVSGRPANELVAKSRPWEQKQLDEDSAGQRALAAAMTITNHNGERSLRDKAGFTPIIDAVHTYWSVAVPSWSEPDQPDPKLNAHVDCVLVTENTILLIDTKMWRGGNIEYRNGISNNLVTYKKGTRVETGTPYQMDDNLLKASVAFGSLYPQMTVKTMVIVIPSHAGEATVRSTWSGYIPMKNLSDAMVEIATICREEDGLMDPAVESNMQNLLLGA
jgi:hypothetical protein